VLKRHLRRRWRSLSDAAPSHGPVACVFEHVGAQIVAFRTLLKAPKESVIWFSTHLNMRLRVEDDLSTHACPSSGATIGKA
jgi:hypothetical protein